MGDYTTGYRFIGYQIWQKRRIEYNDVILKNGSLALKLRMFANL